MEALHHHTPLWTSLAARKALGAEVRLKMDALQPVGSFKIRGLGRSCQLGVQAGARRLVTSSGGNAGYAVAYAGRRLGVAVEVYVPRSTPETMRRRLRDEGARVTEHGDSWDDAHARAREQAEAADTAYVHPFDDPEVWAGHATLVEELAADGYEPDALVVSVGGGGLFCGIREGLRRVGWNDLPILAVETEGAGSLRASLEAGTLVTLPRIESLAVTLGARTVAAQALEEARSASVTSWLVTDRAAVAACRRFLDEHRLLVEPACGAALATVYEEAPFLAGKKRILVVVCGGAGVSLELLNRWSERVGIPPSVS